MEDAITTVVEVFINASGGNPDLDSKKFRKLVSTKLRVTMEDKDSRSAIQEMQMGLDDNYNGKVAFKEYLSLIGCLAVSASNRQMSQRGGT